MTSKWAKEVAALRKIISERGLTEEVKWGQPCFTFKGKNIVIIGELKNSAVIGFFKGYLLTDPENVLVFPGKNTKSAKSIYFSDLKEIIKLKPVIKQLVYEAIEIEKAG